MNKLLQLLDIELEQDEQLIYVRAPKLTIPKEKEKEDSIRSPKKIRIRKDTTLDGFLKKHEPFLANRKKNYPEFLVLTDQRIITKESTLSWERIFEVRKQGETTLYLTNPNHLTKEFSELSGSTPFDIHPGAIRFISNDKQYSQIMKAWMANGPSAKINTINDKVIEKFNLKKSQRVGAVASFSGQFSSSDVSYFCSASFPFSGISLTFSFQEPPSYSLLIDHETLSSGLKSRLGFKDIQAGNKQFDDGYLVKSNQPEQLQQLLSEEVISKFNQLYNLGKCSWSYSPPSTSKFKTGRKLERDDESVLDAPESILTKEANNDETSPLHSDLVIKGELNVEFRYNYKLIEQFILITFELTERIVNGFFLEETQTS